MRNGLTTRSGQKETVAPHVVRSLLEAQLHKAKEIVGVMGYYDRPDVSHPDRSNEWLTDQVKKRTACSYPRRGAARRVQQGAQPHRAAGACPRQRQRRPGRQGEGQGREGGQGQGQGRRVQQHGKKGAKGKKGDESGKDGKGSRAHCWDWCGYGNCNRGNSCPYRREASTHGKGRPSSSSQSHSRDSS
eukprot:13827754-Alexandrium_andersonii.AAC.2